MSAEVACRRAARLLSAALDRSLTAEELAILERHLAACLYCRNYEIQIKFLHKAAGRFRTDGD